MKQFYLTTVLLALIFFTQQSWGQIKLGDNPQSLDPSALLELESTSQGLLLPRMTSAQRDAIPMDSRPVGLVIFNTDTNALQYLFEETTTNAKGEQRQVLRWESATDDSIPFTQPSNPVVGELYYDRSGGILHLWDGNQWIPVGGPNATSNSGGATTTVTYQSLSLVGNQLSISNGNTIDLSSLVVSITGPIGPQGPAGNPATDDQSLAASPLSANNTMTLAISGGNTITLDLSVLDDSGTDSQTLTNSALSAGSTMTIAISDGNTVTLDFSPLAATGLVSVTESGRTGHRLATAKATNHGDIGNFAIDLSTQTAASTSTGARGNYSFASGRNTIAMGDYSVAIGRSSVASGTYSIALGSETEALGFSSIAWGATSSKAVGDFSTSWGSGNALGNWSTAFGRSTQAGGSTSYARGLNTKANGNFSSAWGVSSEAPGSTSTAWGWSTIASGSTTTAGGAFTTAESFGQTSLGIYSTSHTGTPSTTGIVSTDRLLVIGNGTSTTNRSDALVMLKNGNTTLNGALTINNPTSTSSYTLPTAKGTNGQVLTIDNATTGTTTWTTVAGGGGSGTDSQTLTVGSGTASTTVLNLTNSSSVTFEAGANIVLNEDTANNTIIISATGSLTAGTDDQNLSVGAGTASTSMINIETGSGITLAAGENITLAENTTTGVISITAMAGVAATGLVSVTENGNSGYRLALEPALNHGDIGKGAVDVSVQSVPTIASGARGDYSFAGGFNTTASGDYSFAIGNKNLAQGLYSFAIGGETTASGQYSFAGGRETQALGDYSFALGREGTAATYGQTTLGFFNTPQAGSATSRVATNALFVIGNGTSAANRSDALVMLKNGNTTLNGALTINNPTSTSSYTLPTAKGTAGQVLTVQDASTGTTTWTTISGGSAATGIVSVTENGNSGYRLALEPAANHGGIGDDAVDLSIQTSTSSTKGATGQYSFASGRFVRSSGFASTAMGNNTMALGDGSTAMGRNNYAFGSYSTAMGYYTTAESYGQITTGIFNTAQAGNETSIVPTDRLFVIGNGTGTATRSDALVMLKNGNTTLNGALTINNPTSTSSYTLPTAKGSNGQVLTMQDASTGTTTWTTIPPGVATSGLVSVTENGNSGYRLALEPAANHGDIGDDAVDLSIQTSTSTTTGARGRYSFAAGRGTTALGRYSTAMGDRTTAVGNSSTAMGDRVTASAEGSTAMGVLSTAREYGSTAMGIFTTASGGSSIAMGNSTTASGDYSTAMGENTTASGDSSTALGRSTTATGTYSTAMGYNTGAESYGQTTIGIYNTTQMGNIGLKVDTDRLFVIGNGTHSMRSDALVMLKNGATTLNGPLTINVSSTTASYTLPLAGGSNGQVLSMQDASAGTTTWTTVTGGAGVFGTNGTTLVSTVGSTTHDFIIGSDQLDNLTGADDDARMFFDKSKGAFRAGYASGTSWNTANVGDRSVAFGYNTEASGERTTAFGNVTEATSYAEIAMGSYNTIAAPLSTSSWNTNDRLLVIGKGNSAGNRADALVMLKSGATTLNGPLTINVSSTTASYTLPLAGGSNGQVLSMQDASAGTTTWTTLVGGGVPQNINNLTFNSMTNSLTVGITGGTSQEVSLATLGSTTVSGTLRVNKATRLGSSTLLRNPGMYSAAPNPPSAIIGIEGQTESRLRITAADRDTYDGSISSSIDMYANNAADSGGVLDLVAGNVTSITSPNNNAIRFYTYPILANQQLSMVINSNGNVGIGDSTPTEGTLVVSGTIVASGNITSNSTLTPDYVFEHFFTGKSALNPSYTFPKLEEIEAFVKENHHLPGVPSAKEVKAQGGIVLNRAAEVQLEKIEELYLHTIEQQKQLDAKDKEIEALKSRLAIIEKALGIKH